MIELFVVVSFGGQALFQHAAEGADEKRVLSLVSRLISSRILESKMADSAFSEDGYTLKWQRDNARGLLSVLAYLNMSKLGYDPAALLRALTTEFVSVYNANSEDENKEVFTKRYLKILDVYEFGAATATAAAPRSFNKTKKGQEMKLQKSVTQNKAIETPEEDGDEKTEEQLFEESLRRRQQKRPGKYVPKAKSKKKDPVKRKATKVGDQRTQEEKDALDRSAKPTQEDEDAQLEHLKEKFGDAPEVGDDYADEWVNTASEEFADVELKGKKAEKQSSGFFGNMFKTLTGSKVLTREDLEPVMKQLHENLTYKNVASKISEELCEAVITKLEGTKQPSFSTLYRTTVAALESTLATILTPKREIDILQEVAAVNAQNRPYTIVFVGVNGVGKSTSLSKLCAFFKTKGKSVGIAACDTFRSGAIEQLKTHARALDLTLYEKGYSKDAASVAAQGIEAATREGKDVLMIDTAGRMQNNMPLMKALSKLIVMNNPDLILFVGEALVGNDGVDQLVNFNEALGQLSVDKNPRLIDGIVLTKFDTIDDKVGAAISMTYSTGVPIMFVGVGQTYKDLRTMNVQTLLKSLLAPRTD